MALDHVTIEVRGGEIHAILGENGAGKSTFASIAAGLLSPDAGTLEFGGSSVAFSSARDAQQVGIAMVHQHFTLVPAFTVRENLELATLRSPVGYEGCERYARQFGWDVPFDQRVDSLSVGDQQRIEILKSLAVGGKVVFFDEPTASLSRDEVDGLFDVLKSLRDVGTSIVLITHKLREVLAVADVITVLRRGRVVEHRVPRREVTANQLAFWMVGEVPSALTKKKQAVSGETALRATDVWIEGKVNGVSLAVSRGEIVGIGGVDGNGQLELAEALAGVRPVSRGQIEGNENAAYIPQDRRRDGLAPHLSVFDNLMIAGHRRPELRAGGLLNPASARRWAFSVAARYDVRMPNLDAPAASLSGGNQQKVVLARVLSDEPILIIAVNPTRGLDVRASAFVHEMLLEAREKGAAIVLFSTDLDELAALSDRSLIMSGGRFTEGATIAESIGGVE